MYSTSYSGQFSTASPAPLVASAERRDHTASQLSRGQAEGQSASAITTTASAAVANTPSAYLTYAGVGASTASIASSSFLPSIIDNNNIEESFVDISSVPVSSSSSLSGQQRQSGFVPPVIDPIPREPATTREPTSYSRDQSQPQNLSINRVETGSQEANRDRSHSRLELSHVSRDNSEAGRQERDRIVGIARPEQEYNHANNVRGHHNNNNNNNNQRKSTKNPNELSHVLRSIPSSDNSMVTSNAAMSLQNQLANWHIPVSLGGSNGSLHPHPPLPHHGGGQAVGQQTAAHHAASQAMMAMSSTPPKQQHQAGPRRHTGPRQPKNDSNLSPEEAERRRVRRERNKLAAAKCRKRRMDHTAQLQEETDELESVQREIHNEILNLQQQKEQLEFILQAHKVHCKRGIPIATLPPVRIPALTLPAPSTGDDGLKDELASNLSNDSLSSTTSNYSPAPATLQTQMTTTTAAGSVVPRHTHSGGSNNGVHLAPTELSFSAALNIVANKDASVTRFGVTSNGAAVTAAAPTLAISAASGLSTIAATANRPTSLPIVVKQEPPFLKMDHQNQQQHQHEDVKPEAMDISVTQATGVSISTPKVSPRVLSLFDVIDHTGLTPITGGGVITSASNTPISTATVNTGGGGGGGGAFTPNIPNSSSTPPTTKMGTPTERGNAASSEKPTNSGQPNLMSL